MHAGTSIEMSSVCDVHSEESECRGHETLANTMDNKAMVSAIRG